MNKHSSSILTSNLWHTLNLSLETLGQIQVLNKRMARFQKLIVFLTLHGHSIHCQERELSEFPMRYLQVHYQQRKLPEFPMRYSSSRLMLTAGPRDQFARWRRSRRRLSV
jgi:hypothetical protein